MAIKVGGIEVVDNNRQLKNIDSVDSGSVNVLNSALNTDPTRATLTKTFTNGETASITLNQAVSTAPVVGVTKEVPQTGISSKGAWDVNATASNYELHNTAYDTTLTPSQVANTSISDATYASKSLDVTANETILNDIFFKPDGTTLYILGAGGDRIRQYTVSTAWDITTATSAGKSFDVSPYETTPEGLYIKPDGTSVFYTGRNTDIIRELTLSTAWDISTASVSSNTLNVASQETAPRGLWFKPDGTKLFMIGSNSYAVFEYSLSTAWDITTASLTTNHNIGPQSNSPRDVSFNSDGTKMYMLDGNVNGGIHQYSLSTAWDVSTASYDSVELDTSTETTYSTGVFIGDNGTKIYVAVNETNDIIFQYNNGSDALVLGTGSFASTDVGKRIQGNGGDVILTSTAGAYDTTGGSDFTDTSTIASGSWTMHGLKSAGATDGLTIAGFTQAGSNFQTSPTLLSATSSSFSGTYTNTIIGTTISHDGLHLYNIAQSSNQPVHHFTLSTAFDLSTATYAGSWNTTIGNSNSDLEISPDGRYMYVCVNSSSQSRVQAFYLDVAYYPESGVTLMGTHTFSSGLSANTPSDAGKITFSPDGTKMYHMPYTYASNASGANAVAHTAPSGTWTQVGTVQQYTLGTAWNIWSGNVTYNHSVLVPWKGNSYASFAVTSDGKWLISGTYNNTELFYYPLTTPFDISTQVVSLEGFIDMQQYMSSGQSGHGMIAMQHRDGNLYSVSYSLQVNNAHDLGTENLFSVPTSQYHVAATKTSGQIDSSHWVDINSMTADQSLGDGEAYYAVSTDDRTTWSVAKASDGVRPIVRDNAGTWQYNSEFSQTGSGYGIATATYDNKSFNPAEMTLMRSLSFKSDGTKMYLSPNGTIVYQYSLSTAWDVSTASYDSVSFNTNSQDLDNLHTIFSPDGTKMYVNGGSNDRVNQYNLSTAWDLSTASYASKFFSYSSQTTAAYGLMINGDGTKMYVMADQAIYQYSLSTAYDASTATYDSVSLSLQNSGTRGGTFKSDGSVMYVAQYNTGGVDVYNLTTAYDLSTATYDSYFNTNANVGTEIDVEFSSDGTKMYVVDFGTGVVYQYTSGSIITAYVTTPTWTNATTNDEFYALQQALGVESNRMDKTQLDAVADGSHFTLGDTLDLAIALKQDTASASLPTSDGVSINYDAQALNQGAVLGTDYDYDFPDSTTVRITSNAAQNLKIRVV